MVPGASALNQQCLEPSCITSSDPCFLCMGYYFYLHQDCVLPDFLSALFLLWLPWCGLGMLKRWQSTALLCDRCLTSLPSGLTSVSHNLNGLWELSACSRGLYGWERFRGHSDFSPWRRMMSELEERWLKRRRPPRFVDNSFRTLIMLKTRSDVGFGTFFGWVKKRSGRLVSCPYTTQVLAIFSCPWH